METNYTQAELIIYPWLADKTMIENFNKPIEEFKGLTKTL